jgi:quinol monooxygenase YgiN
MIIVTGAIRAREGAAPEIRRLAIAHCRRSRAEPGCLAHQVHIDCEAPDRFVFVEYWRDAAALKAHFALPASREFVRAIGALAAEAPSMQIYHAEETTPAAIAR